MAYKPTPASTAPKPQLPEVPTIPTNFKAGDAYTVYGITHHLNSRIHAKDVTGKEITVVGTIVAENISSADACGWHKTGSTALQEFLLDNQSELARRHRLWYPSEGLLVCAHHTVAWTLQGRTTSPWGAVPAMEGGGEA